MSSDYEAGDDLRDDEAGAEPAPAADPIPRDEWVSRVVSDPASPSNAVVLSGYVGDAAEPGRTRIYTDPSLGSYVEVSDEDVLHHEPLEGGVPAGGSMVWVRGDAMVGQGPPAGGQGAAGGDFFAGPVLEQNREAGAGGASPQMHITLLTVPHCHTFGFTCTAFCPGGAQSTAATQCTHAGCGPIGVTGWQGCGQPHISLPGCVHTGTCPPISLPGCVHTGTCPHISLPGCVHTGTCTPDGGTDTVQAAARGIDGPTAWLGCTSAPGCPSSSTCTPETHAYGCPSSSTCTPDHTHAMGCPSSSTCSPEAMAAAPVGKTGWLGCTRVLSCQPQRTFATVCTQIGCPPGPTGWLGCTHVLSCQPQRTLATVCTQIGCPPPPRPTAMLGCTHIAGCPNTKTCTPHTHAYGCPNTSTCTPHTHAMGCPASSSCAPEAQAAAPVGPTGWLHCTSALGCLSSSTCPPPHTIETVCTQIGCPPIGPTGTLGCTHMLGCPSTSTCTPQTHAYGCPSTSTCTPGGTDTVQAAGFAAAGPVGPTGTLNCTQMLGCPSSSTCPPGPIGPSAWLHCPPTMMPGCPNTSTCTPTHAMGCPSSSTCPPGGMGTGPVGPTAWLHCPPTMMPGCPNTSTCTPTHAMGCPSSSTCTPQGEVASAICATAIACNITFFPICRPPA